MKYLVKFVVVTLFVLVCTYAQAEQKIVYIDMKYVLNNSKAGKGAQDFLKKTFDENLKKFSKMEKALKILHSASTEKRVYLHCLRGLGRTGTVVGCYFIEKGFSTEEALTEISKLRKGTLGSWWKSPELNLQINFIKRWELQNSYLFLKGIFLAQ